MTALADWSPIATHAFAHGRTAWWFRAERAPTFRITHDDGVGTQIWWTGEDWSGRGADALEFASREDAGPELTRARRSMGDGRANNVRIEEF